MPLAFDSVSHGRISFGFFNIDSDMLLLQEQFFFADAFCKTLRVVASLPVGDPVEASWPGWVIENPDDIGDLMGAIHGVRFTGFIGDTYRRYPFPAREEDFKQKPEGDGTQGEFREMIGAYAEPSVVPLTASPATGEAAIGPYRFTTEGFGRLLAYVWRGGMPRWRDEVRPDYVLTMAEAVSASEHWLFDGVNLVD
jgi:hypothetical protein